MHTTQPDTHSNAQPDSRPITQDAVPRLVPRTPGPALAVHPSQPTVPTYGMTGDPARALGLPFPGRNGTRLLHEDPGCLAERVEAEGFCVACGGRNIRDAARTGGRPGWSRLDRTAYNLIGARLRLQHRVPYEQMSTATSVDLKRSIDAVADPALLDSYDMREASDDFKLAVALLKQMWADLEAERDELATSGYVVQAILALRVVRGDAGPADIEQQPLWGVLRPHRLLGKSWRIAQGLRVRARLDDRSDRTLVEGPAGAINELLSWEKIAWACTAQPRPDYRADWQEHVLHLWSEDADLEDLLTAVSAAHQ